jgi:hypothetical protein
MRYTSAVVANCVLVFLPVAASAQEQQLSALNWLTGCWASEAGEPGTGEHWLPLAGGTMLGVGRTVKAGKTVEFEFLRIQQNAEGQVVYIALPSRQKETVFTARTLAQGSAIFENLLNEFPQRVIYTSLLGDRLVARIEGLRNGVLRGVDFPMRRTACESLAAK